jgi:hypothetical protein
MKQIPKVPKPSVSFSPPKCNLPNGFLVLRLIFLPIVTQLYDETPTFWPLTVT